jgi:lipopolysaccharide/colanic/teichoic acid biosynthesis glycosyltransferase
MATAALPLERPRRAGRAVQPVAQQLPPVDESRRALNVAVAFVALLLVSPLMIIIAVAIKLTSRGPVFYTQTRVGINRRRMPEGAKFRNTDYGGKPFRIFKFRTMQPSSGQRPDAEMWATPDDPRVTRIGRILRLYRLDELPQLLNVLRGDMEIVGPRPEQPSIFVRMRTEIGGYHLRQQVRPGITGWAQINQQYDQSIDDVRQKLRYDLEYIQRRSVTEDLRIMLRTLPVIVGKQGAW